MEMLYQLIFFMLRMISKITSTTHWWLESLFYSAGDFLLELIQSLTGTKKLFELFNFMISVMKYNAVYLKEEAVSGIIRYVLIRN